MTFYVAPGYVRLPGGDWLDKMSAARQEMDAIPEDQRTGAIDVEGDRCSELHGLLENLEGVALCDMDGGVVEDLRLAFMHFDEQTRRAVLAVIIDEKLHDDDTHSTPFDRLFTGQYDPEVLQLTEQDTPYVIVQFDEHGQAIVPATVIQPHEEDTPEYVCGEATLPASLIAQLLQLAS